MTRIGLIASFATASVMIPAGFRPLGAGAPEDPAARRPAAEVLSLKDGTVEVSLDRARVAAGESVRVTLIASSETPRNLDVTVALMEQRGSEMARVVPPPVTVESEDMRLVALPGGGPARELAFRLEGEGPSRGEDALSYAGRATQYTVVVQQKAAKAQAKKRRDVYFGESGTVVALPVVATRPQAYAVTIETPRSAAPGKPFTATVHVRNTSKKTLTGLNISLAALADVAEDGGMDDYAVADDVTIDAREGEEMYVEKLAPGVEKTFTFQVTPAAARTSTSLRAYSYAEYGGPARGDVLVRHAEAPAAAVAQAVFAEPPPAAN